MEPADENDPARELTLWPAIRDLFAGSALLAFGIWRGHSALDLRADGIDFVFDGLGLFWVLWAAYRLARLAHRSIRASGRPRG